MIIEKLNLRKIPMTPIKDQIGRVINEYAACCQNPFKNPVFKAAPS